MLLLTRNSGRKGNVFLWIGQGMSEDFVFYFAVLPFYGSSVRGEAASAPPQNDCAGGHMTSVPGVTMLASWRYYARKLAILCQQAGTIVPLNGGILAVADGFGRGERERLVLLSDNTSDKSSGILSLA